MPGEYKTYRVSEAIALPDLEKYLNGFVNVVCTHDIKLTSNPVTGAVFFVVITKQ